MRILMVCLGNICRSPLAEGILQGKIDEQNLDWAVDSAGTSGWHEGEKPDRRSIEIARSHGLDLTNQRSRKIVKADLSEFDLILVMDESNYQEVIGLNPELSFKVKRILDYGNVDRSDVPDPYYDGGFPLVYTLLDNACDGLIKSILEEQSV